MRKHSTLPSSMETRQRILDFVAEFRRIPPWFQSPTLREIAEHLDMSITNVNWHISCMVRDGQLLKSGGHRGLVPPITKELMIEAHEAAYMAQPAMQDPETRAAIAKRYAKYREILEKTNREEPLKADFDKLFHELYHTNWDGTVEPLEDIHARVKEAVKCSRCDGTGVWNYYDNPAPCPDCNKAA